MVRIIQPAGFSKAPLVRIGLLEDVEEVILLCSPESMNDEEFERIQSVAKELGSKAKYTREIIPVIGATVREIISQLLDIKNSLDEKKTLISTAGSTLKFGNCVLYAFPKCETLTMNWKDSSYFLSRGVTKKMPPMPEEFVWKMFGLQHRIENGNDQILSDERIIAQPSSVSLQGEKIQIEWENESSDGQNKPGANKKAKIIAAEMGALCRINAEERYDFVVKGSTKFDYFDRYSINTNKPVQPNSMFKPAANEFFSTIQMPTFPHGKAASNASCLHIIVNERDITPTAFSIMLHKPDHVILWMLNSTMNDQKRAEFEGKVSVLVHYLTGEIIPNLEFIKEITNSKILKEYPPPKMNIEFHMVSLQNLGDSQIILPQIPPVENTLVELNSGFLGLQDQMMKTLSNANIDFERWITDSNKMEAVQISALDGNIKKESYPNLSRLLLRKRVPTSGTVIPNGEDYIGKLGIVLPSLLQNKIFEHSLWKPNCGIFVDENTNKIEVKGEKFGPTGSASHLSNSYFEVNLDNEDAFLTFGEQSSMVGIWLEELAAFLIHFYWRSRHTVIGLGSKPITGDWNLGSYDDVDIYCITDFGEVIGEAKAIASLEPNEKISQIIGQLSGETFVVGIRHGQIPMLVIATDSSPFDTISKQEGIVICSWWELQYPERIINRIKTGKRSEEELAEIAALNKRRDKIIHDANAAEEAKKVAKEAAKEERRISQAAEKAKRAAKKAANKEKTIAEDAQKGREKIMKDKNLKKQEDVAFMERNTLFSGEIPLESVEKNEDSKNSCLILDVDELRGKVITMSKRKFLKFFDVKKNRDTWTGYDINIVTKSGAAFSKVDVEDDVVAYLLHCEAVVKEEE